MRRFTLCRAGFGLALVALCLPVVAETAGGASAPPSVPPSYVLVPGDVIDVSVPSHEGYDRTLTIQPDGRIEYPTVGEIVAAGLTPVQLAARLQQGLNVELVDPQVTVSLKELNKVPLGHVSLLGAVKSPGIYDLKEQATLAEMLAAAGGPTSVANLHRVIITRAGIGKRVIADISGAAQTGQESVKVDLRPGDQILVPEGASPSVTVLGEVVRPGSIEISGEMRLITALSQAGGPTPAADLERVTLTRAGRAGHVVLDLSDLLTRGQASDPAANVLLQPGDTIVLPATEQKYYVLGEVGKAQAYPLKPNDRLIDAITTAGGTTQNADLSKVTLIRKDARGQAVAHAVDLQHMMKKGDMARNETLQPGDVIFVPNRAQKRPLLDYLGVFTPLLYLLR